MLNKLFENAGKKLQILAKVMFFVIFLGGTVYSIILAGYSLAYLLLIPASLLLGWVSSIALYAFGELCESIGNIRKNIYEMTVVTEKRFPDISKEFTER